MKKVLALLIMITALVSCESDVKFNDPGFQGRKDNFTWKADISSAFIADGMMTITAFRGLENVTLTFEAPTTEINYLNPVTYAFRDANGDDTNQDNVAAAYQFVDQGVAIDYYTGPNSELEDPGNVEVTITRYSLEKMTVSGEFKFNAKYTGESDLVPDNVNFQQGVFYNVPVTQ